VLPLSEAVDYIAQSYAALALFWGSMVIGRAFGVAESRYETVIVMLNGVVRSEASGESLRSPLLRTLREASYSMTIHTPKQQRRAFEPTGIFEYLATPRVPMAGGIGAVLPPLCGIAHRHHRYGWLPCCRLWRQN